MELNPLETRRQFFKRMSELIGGSVLLSSMPWINVLADEKANSNGKTRIGVIGTGSRGQFLMLFLTNIPNCEIISVCDNYPPNLKRGLELTDGKAKTYEDYKLMLEKERLDAVVIATPLNEHAHITIDALNAGLHVFCEKAMARNYEDCFKMVQAQKSTGKLLMIGHQRMFDLKYLKGIEKLMAGEIGKITQIKAFWHRNNDWRRSVPSPELEKKINWRLYKEFSAGLMTELASHQIQVANWILRAFPTSVMGSGSINYWKDGREVYDNVNLIYNYPNGIKLIYDSLTSNKYQGCEEQIQGNLGLMALESGKIYPETLPPAPGIQQLINNIEHKIFDPIIVGGASWVPDTASDTDGENIINQKINGDGTDIEMESFVASVIQNKVNRKLTVQGYYASMASLMGEQAMDTMETVHFPEEFIIDDLENFS